MSFTLMMMTYQSISLTTSRQSKLKPDAYLVLRLVSTQRPRLWYTTTGSVFFRDPNAKLQYVFGEMDGSKWRIGSDTNIMLPAEEILNADTFAFVFPCQEVGGVSAVIVDDAFLRSKS